MAEFMEIVPATDYGDPKNRIHPINRVLQAYRGKKLSVLEILAKESGCTIVPKHNFIIDCAGRLILPGQLFEANGLVNSTVRCVICKNVFDFNTILAHLENDFRDGHELSTQEVIKLFAREFYNWEYRDSRFSYRGEDIEV